MNNLSTPTAEQLAAVRLAHWHQNAEPILTINMLRDWLNASGLVFFTSRAAQLPSPAPSFVEAVLGAPNSVPTLADTEQSRSLLTRLILDGGAIPLNLLGSPANAGTETPDFIVSPLAFSYIFTLRGDKTWKQAPATSGATRVSPLALNAYTLLSQRAKDHATGMSSYDLTTQLGKEVTETAVLRALTELWQHLRVFPVPQLDGAPTLWELATTRFTKQIKAGANAGQPTALSALVSLYLGQALLASEEEIEIFLSPLASRSRIRDVVHALLSARQLETIAVDGRTVLHVTGELPAFLNAEAPVSAEEDSAEVTSAETVTDEGETPRITKFIPKPRKVGTGFVTKPGRNTGDAPTERERRPFNQSGRTQSDRPSYNKPWEEEKAGRVAAARKPSRVSDETGDSASRAASRSYEQRERRPGSDREGKRPFGAKPSFGGKPRFGGDRPTFGGNRPAFRRDNESGEGRPPRREFGSRPYNDRSSGESSSEGPRKTFARPGGFAQKREGFAGRSDSRSETGSRPPRREFGSRPFGEQRSEERPRRTYGDKPAFGATRKPWTPREDGPSRGRPAFSRDRDERPAGARGFSSEGRAGRPSGPPYRKFDAPRTPRPFSSERPEGSDRPARASRTDRADRPARPEGGYAGRSSGGFGAKKPYSKSSGGYAGKSGSSRTDSGGSTGKKPFGRSAAGGPGKSAGPFDKFKGSKKPFGNRPPARKFKREDNQ